MTSAANALLALLACVIALGGCATNRAPTGDPSAPETASADGPMTQQRMEILFADQVDAILGPPGAIQTKVDGINIYLISNPANDRMRIMAPVALASSLNPRAFHILLRANFNSTRDARYAISEDIVYATFIHPISSLTPGLLRSALAQIISLTKTFGTTYSSGEPRAAGAPSDGP